MEKTKCVVAKQLKEQWEEACNAYLLELSNMFGWDMLDTYGSWVGDDVGGVFTYGDFYFISMEDIRYCVDNKVTFEEFNQYSEYNSAACSLGFDNINLRSWHMGCPRLPKEAIERLQNMKEELYRETERLKDGLKNGKHGDF